MSNNDDDDEFEKLPHIVLINHEEQYSLWYEALEIPDGWKKVWAFCEKNLR